MKNAIGKRGNSYPRDELSLFVFIKVGSIFASPLRFHKLVFIKHNFFLTICVIS